MSTLHPAKCWVAGRYMRERPQKVQIGAVVALRGRALS